jgi:uncharacterized membrane protein
VNEHSTTTAQERARRAVLTAMAVLGVLVLAAAMRSATWPVNLVLALACLIPLLLPLRGLLTGSRRAHAWATLCVAPYVVAGITDTIANPALRGTAALVLLASLAWFATLVWYLRVTRPQTGAHQPSPPASA